jgi:hypothetical protein
VHEENDERNQEVLKAEIERYQRESLEIHSREINRLMEESRSQERVLREQLGRLTREVQDRDSKIFTMSVTLEEKPEDNNKNEDKANAELISKIKQLEIENQNLKVEISKKPPPTVAPQPGCCSSCTIQ